MTAVEPGTRTQLLVNPPTGEERVRLIEVNATLLPNCTTPEALNTYLRNLAALMGGTSSGHNGLTSPEIPDEEHGTRITLHSNSSPAVNPWLEIHPTPSKVSAEAEIPEGQSPILLSETVGFVYDRTSQMHAQIKRGAFLHSSIPLPKSSVTGESLKPLVLVGESYLSPEQIYGLATNITHAWEKTQAVPPAPAS